MPVTEAPVLPYEKELLHELQDTKYPALIRLDPLKSESIEFFRNIYLYPPKFTVKWEELDELKSDTFFEYSYETLGQGSPWGDLNLIGKSTLVPKPSIKFFHHIGSYLDNFISNEFYKSKTQSIQKSLASIPIYLIFNGHGEIVLNTPTKMGYSNFVGRTFYSICSDSDTYTRPRHKIGFFFFSRKDAEVYLQEVAKSDVEGTNTLGLSIHCLGLDSAYRISREDHPEIDFRFVPDFDKVKNLLNNPIGKSDIIFDDAQHQLRTRQRTITMFPFLGKLGRMLSIRTSFLVQNEYFKGVPIYVIQLSSTARSSSSELLCKITGVLKDVRGRLFNPAGFGRNRIIQGSIYNTPNSEKLINYVFFDEQQALNFVQKQSRKVRHYNASSRNKPRIYIYNLEDFIEFWEEVIFKRLLKKEPKERNTIFEAKSTYFIPQKEDIGEIFNIRKSSGITIFRNVKQTFNVKVKVLKQFINIFFSAT